MGVHPPLHGRLDAVDWISHMFDCQSHVCAGGHHLTNVALHALAVIGLFSCSAG